MLLGPDHGMLLPLKEDKYSASHEFAKQIASRSEGPVSVDRLRAMRGELLARFSSGNIGSLMSERILNRDQQLRTLSGIGPEVILDMMAEGLMLTRISKRLEVSYSVLVEYMEQMTTESIRVKAEVLSADMMIDDALEDLEAADLDREEISRRHKILDAAMKVAKAKSPKWAEKKQDNQTLIQNNYGTPSATGDAPLNSEGKRVVHGFQLVMSSEEDFPKMNPLAVPTSGPEIKPAEDPLIVNGEFHMVPPKKEE